MEKKLTTDQMKSLLTHVIKTIDHWWVETTNIKKQGCFTRSNTNNSLVTYQDYVEWRYSVREDCKDYVSMFISLEYENDTDYIRITLRKLKDGIYTEYDPFCEIHDGKVNVTISEDTGGYDGWFSVFEGCFNDLTDTIANTVNRFMNPPYDEDEASVNIDDVSKTLSAHDIQDCMIKAMRIMLVDRDTVNELIRLSSKYVADSHDLSAIQRKNMLGYVSLIEVVKNHVVAKIVYDEFILCSFTCIPDTHGPHEFIIRYNSCNTGFEYEQGFIILYKDPDSYCFEYAADGLNVDKVFKPFVNILRNTLNYDMYQQLTKTSEVEESKEENAIMIDDEMKLDCLCTKPQFNDCVLKPGDIIAVTSHMQNTDGVQIPFVTMGIAGHIADGFTRALAAGENIVGTIVQVDPDSLYLFGAWGRSDRRTGIFQIKPEQVSSGELAILGVLLLRGGK